VTSRKSFWKWKHALTSSSIRPWRTSSNLRVVREKSANQIQTTAEKALEHTSQVFGEKAGEVAAVFRQRTGSTPAAISLRTLGFKSMKSCATVRPRPSAVRWGRRHHFAGFYRRNPRNARNELDGFVDEARKSVAEARLELIPSAPISRIASRPSRRVFSVVPRGVGSTLESSVAEAQQRVQQVSARSSILKSITPSTKPTGRLFRNSRIKLPAAPHRSGKRLQCSGCWPRSQPRSSIARNHCRHHLVR